MVILLFPSVRRPEWLPMLREAREGKRSRKAPKTVQFATGSDPFCRAGTPEMQIADHRRHRRRTGHARGQGTGIASFPLSPPAHLIEIKDRRHPDVRLPNGQGSAGTRMNANDRDAHAPLVRKLERLAALTPADRNLLQALPFTMREAAAGQFLVRQGTPATE